MKFSEDKLIEQPAIKLFESLNWRFFNAYKEKQEDFGRIEQNEVLLPKVLKQKLTDLNPTIPTEGIEQAIEEISQSRASLDPIVANKEIYDLLKNGFLVQIKDQEELERVRYIDFEEVEKNDFLLVSQLWIKGDMHTRRTDLIGFVNGIPLLFIELKAAHQNLKSAFDNNLRDYKDTIPQLFWYNAFIILSNGLDSKCGSISSQWEHFNEWKKINSEGEEGEVSMETILKGMAEQTSFLDLVENYITYDDREGSLIKILARNHQFLGVNNAVKNFSIAKDTNGKVGVFWHTQGSGKSFSMVFFVAKVLRKFMGNYTFLIVTDRKELDKQIYKQFVSTGIVTEEEAQAKSSAHLRQLLQEDHRMVFTLIQKFQTKSGETYPELSNRNDIIVITDEAHRSQYETLALNMRNALPNACFLGFTGTPLIDGASEKTKEVFGDYVSIYDFKQSVEDKATVPLYYENRIPEMQLTNADFEDELAELIESADLDDVEYDKLEREFARQYHLITRDERLDVIANDIVHHFFNRGEKGKAMVVCIDKVTTVRMYDKVKTATQKYLAELKNQPQSVENNALIHEIENFESAVIVSQSQNEIDDFRKKGLDIKPHRERMLKEDLEVAFKKKNPNLRMVFVCNMWLTGFDVPSLNTMYIDKPMKNHTLMQAIARANRVNKDKTSGLIIDYVGIFRNLKKALAIYAQGSGSENLPILPKSELVSALTVALEEMKTFCKEEVGFDLDELVGEEADLHLIKLFGDAINAIVSSEELKKRFKHEASFVRKLYKAILPDQRANEFKAHVDAVKSLQKRLLYLVGDVDISKVEEGIEDLLDDSIVPGSYSIADDGLKVDLSEIDFEALKKKLDKNRQNLINEQLKNKIEKKLFDLVALNPTRTPLIEKFNALLDDYNSGRENSEYFFDQLATFARELTSEEKRGIEEGLTEEELALFDILKKPKLTPEEKKKVQEAAKDLLVSLKWAKLSRDWKRTQRTRSHVLITVKDLLDEKLPRSYTIPEYESKCEETYNHLYNAYEGAGRSVYAATA